MAGPFLGEDEVVDRVDLTHEYGTRPLRRWRNAATGAARLVHVTFGQLADGRWYAHSSAEHGGAYVYGADEQGKVLALRLAYRWMRDAGGRWWPTPAAYDGRGEPVDGLPWIRRSGEWHLEGGDPLT